MLWCLIPKPLPWEQDAGVREITKQTSCSRRRSATGTHRTLEGFLSSSQAHLSWNVHICGQLDLSTNGQIRQRQPALAVKNTPASAGRIKVTGSVPGSGRSPGEGNGNPLQYARLENPHGQRSLEGYSPWGRKESDMTERVSTAQHNGCLTLWILKTTEL